MKQTKAIFFNDRWAVLCETCRVIYGHLPDETTAEEAAESHVHRIELTKKQVEEQRDIT